MKKYFLKYKGELVYTLSSYTTPVITMVTNIVTAAFLKPNELGIIQSILILLPYLSFMHFGVFNGLNRNLAFYRAQKNDVKVQQLVDASFTVAFINGVIGGMIGICYLVNYMFFNPSKIYFFSSILLFLNLLFNPLITHFETTYRSGQNFKVLGKITLIENLLYAFTNLLPIWIGYLGKIMANAVRVLSRFILRFRSQPYRAQKPGKLKDVLELSRVGIPLLLGGYLYGIVLVSDQTMISKYLGTESLGLYSLSIFLMTAIAVIPTTVNTLLYPKASAVYGKTKNNKSLRGFFWKSLFINGLILIPICVILYFIMEPLTLFFLPKYVNGLSAAKINLFTCLTFISNGPSIIIGVVRKNGLLLFVYVGTIISMWLFTALSDKSTLSITVFAWVRFVASFVISVFTLVYSYYLTNIDEYRA